MLLIRLILSILTQKLDLGHKPSVTLDRSVFLLLICQQRRSSKLLTGRVLKIPPSGLPGGPVAKTPCSQCRGPGFDPWSGNLSSHATTKDPTCHSKDWRSQYQLRPSAVKQIRKYHHQSHRWLCPALGQSHIAYSVLWIFEHPSTPMSETEKTLSIEPTQLYQEYREDIFGTVQVFCYT